MDDITGQVDTMKKLLLILAALGLAFSAGAFARGHGGHYGGHYGGGHYYGHSHVGVGLYFGGPYWGGYGWPGYWGGYPPAYYDYGYGYPAYSAAPTRYVEQPAAPAQPPAGANDWYYCSAQGKYYPYVKTCPSGWSRIPAVPDGANSR